MALPSSFVNTTRSRVTAFLKIMEDMVSLQTEFNALGGTAFTNLFDFSGENASTYDMTEAEFNAMLSAIGQVITVYQNGSITTNANRQRDLYRGKVS